MTRFLRDVLKECNKYSILNYKAEGTVLELTFSNQVKQQAQMDTEEVDLKELKEELEKRNL